MKRLFIFIFPLISALVFAQKKELTEVSMDALITETQFSSDSENRFEMIWWLPKIFWEISFSQDPSISEEDIISIREMFEEYELFAVLNGKIGFFGGVTYQTLEEILPKFSVSLNGVSFENVDQSNISADLNNFLIVIKPMMANMMGPMGENIHFIFMKPSGNNSGINPYSKQIVSLAMGDFKKEVELPLSSLLMEKKCSQDGKLYNGKWNYCPIDGQPLINQQ